MFDWWSSGCQLDAHINGGKPTQASASFRENRWSDEDQTPPENGKSWYTGWNGELFVAGFIGGDYDQTGTSGGGGGGVDTPMSVSDGKGKVVIVSDQDQ